MHQSSASPVKNAVATPEPAHLAHFPLNGVTVAKHRSYMNGYGFNALSSAGSPNQNLLLAALPVADLERLMPHLEHVAMPLGESIYEPGEKVQFAYFPTTAIASMHHMLASGASAASAYVGSEGLVGIASFMGGDTMPSSAAVQTAGYAYRLTSRVLKNEFHRTVSVREMLLRYTQALVTQMSQTGVCNRHHTMEQQLCCWLLQMLDRSATRELVTTQELIAAMLGVRRESITCAVGKLQRKGLITLRRGHITVLQRAGLELCACECYALVKNEFNRLLGGGVRCH